MNGLWSGQVRRIACETGDPVDDCRVETVNGTALAIQAKRSISLSSKESSELAKTIRQFVQQHLTAGHKEDRLVLVTTSEASGAVRNDLRKALALLQGTAAGTHVDLLGLSQDLRNAHDKFVTHAKRAWKQQRGVHPTAAELEGLLRVCHVWVLDVERGMPGEREALDRLRTMVITDPDHASAAWEVLLGECAELAIAHTDTDQERLQKSLAASGIALTTMRDFTADVERLSRWTQEGLDRLEDGLTTIPAPQGQIAIQRGTATELISRSAEESFLVEGDPGGGKTVILHQLARAGIDAQRPVLFIAVGGLAATSSGSLQVELDLQHPLLDVLAQWSPGSSGLLIIDALDAARADSAAELWYSVIAEMRRRLPHWQVIASIRTWDLQHSRQWRALFPTAPAHVGDLSDQELDQAGNAFPQLAGLLADSTTPQRQLLRNPFNLRLAAELLLEGTTASELVGLGSRLDLLERYWHMRVISGNGGLARAAVLGRLCAEAVSERRLTVPALRLLEGDSAAEPALQSLLSSSVLVPVPGVAAGAGLGPVQFAHHVLFDYAVAVTHFVSFSDRTSGQGLVGCLSADPDLVLFARPSVGIFLQLAWEQGPETFCTLAEQLATPQLPPMARTAVADVVARSTSRPDDLEPLLARVAEGSDEARRTAVATAIAVSLAIKDGVPVDRAVWASIAERLSRDANSAGPALGILVTDLAADADGLPPEALAPCGLAARRLLEHVWTQPSTGTTRLAITTVIATASSDQEAAYVLLRRALEPAQLQERGHNDLLALADVPKLIMRLPRLVSELYVAAMSYQEESTAPTRMGPGVVMSMQSTRRQDFDASKYQLVRAFPEVLRWDMNQAVAILTALSCRGRTNLPVHQIVLAGTAAEIVLDDSRLWDYSIRYISKDLAGLLDSIQSHASAADLEVAQALIHVVTSAPQSASVWRRLLQAAYSNSTLRQALFPQPETIVTQLLAPDLMGPASALVHGVHPTLEPPDRTALEGAILALKPANTEDDGTDDQTAGALTRYRMFLKALSPDHIITPTLRADQTPHPYLRTDNEGEVAAREEAIRGSEGTQDSNANTEVRALTAQLKEFTATYFNETPDTAAISACEGTVAALQNTLEEADAQARAEAEDVLAHAAEIWTRNTEARVEALTCARDILLALATSPRPRPTADNAHFDVGIPEGPRGEAARGLLQVSRIPELYTPPVADALKTLAEDPVGWVRYSIARAPWMLSRTDPTTAWQLLDGFATRDSDDAVLTATVQSACYKMGDAQRGIGLIKRVIERVTPGKGRHSAAETCATAAALLWVYRATPGADTALNHMTSTWTDNSTWSSCLHELRDAGALTHSDRPVRQRALDLFTSLADLALSNVRHALSLESPLAEAETECLQGELFLLDVIAFQLYAASGASDNTEQPPTLEQVRLVNEATPLLRALTAVPVASVVHHLIEIYEHVLDCCPQQALLAVRDVLSQAGTQSGYTGDSLGIAICVRFVERILADHRSTLHTPENLTALREVCDTFIEAGWPQAHRLVYGIEQIFR
ncbi:ATP-binding protein [Streptosporangium minutum]|uniref:ATP-binding protein n=1 Tax=Streptosporangium minutum TaxID=569862 RepID=UPI001056D966|nr:ATP-binding protein [Streptosporangium minutum]